ncbi:MAG: cyclic nucleotide-binding domain-containing protein, partial [Dolichospermum sp.]
MAHNISAQLVSLQQINNILGYSLTTEEFYHYLPELQPINPKVGKFWTGKNVEPGIYIIITGKVRLLDDNDELITTLESGASFGEFTLFPQSQFPPYAARASANLQLCFLPEKLLLPLIAKYPQIREHLW